MSKEQKVITVLNYKALYNEIIAALQATTYADLKEATPETDHSNKFQLTFFQVKELTFTESSFAEYIRYIDRAPGSDGVRRLNQFFKDIYATAQIENPRPLIQWLTNVIESKEGYRFPNIMAYKFAEFNFTVSPTSPRGVTVKENEITPHITLLKEKAAIRIAQHERDMNRSRRFVEPVIRLLEQRAGVRHT